MAVYRIVSIQTSLWAGWCWVQILVGIRDFSHFQNMQTGTGAHPASYSVGTGIISYE